MPGTALQRPLSAIAWELRGAWGSGRRVAVTLERADLGRIEGHVHRVAATGATVTISGLLIPMDRVLAIHWPSRLGDSTVAVGERWRGRARLKVLEGQEELPFYERRPVMMDRASW